MNTPFLVFFNILYHTFLIIANTYIEYTTILIKHNRFTRKLREQRKAYREYSNEHGLSVHNDRLTVVKVKNGDASYKNIYSSGLTENRKGDIIKDNSMYRKTSNTGAFAILPERMSKKHIREIAQKYDINIDGLTLNIDKNEELLRFEIAGEAVPEHIGKVTFFPNAFRSEEEILRTLIHERTHVEQYKKHGAEYVQNNREFFEDEARQVENSIIEQFKKEGRL